MAYLLVSLLFFVTDSAAAKKRVRVKRRAVLRETDRGKAIFLAFLLHFGPRIKGSENVTVTLSIGGTVCATHPYAAKKALTRADLTGCRSVGQTEVWAAKHDCKRILSARGPCIYR